MEMRRKDREVTDLSVILSVIDKCKVIRLGLNDKGSVYIVPLSFGYEEHDEKLTFYFHGAKSGRKYDIIKENPEAGFELDCDIVPTGEGDIPCVYGTKYASIIGNGTCSMVEDTEDKLKALQALMQHQTGRSFEFTASMADSVNVFKLESSDYSCKIRA